MIRAFVGLPLPPDIRDRLGAAQAGLPVGRAVDPEGMHVTLAFLGEQPRPVLEDLHVALEEIAATMPPLTLAVQGVGLFGCGSGGGAGGGNGPRSLHASIVPDPDLKRLRERVLRAVREAGIPAPRTRFVPHVTLARFSRGLGPEDTVRLHDFVARRVGLNVPAFRIEVFTLFRSHLGSEGPVYEALAEYPLEG